MLYVKRVKCLSKGGFVRRGFCPEGVLSGGGLSQIQPHNDADMRSSTNVTQAMLTSQSASADNLVSIS